MGRSSSLSRVTEAFLEDDASGALPRYRSHLESINGGFLIYRAVYRNVELLNHYIEALEADVREELVSCGREHLLEQYAEWTVVNAPDEDQSTRPLGTSIISKGEVRRHLIAWRDEHEMHRPTCH